MKGTVKWFNDSRGFGFITGESGEVTFVHYTAIQVGGFKSLSEGEPVSFDVVESSKGKQASNVVPLGRSSRGNVKDTKRDQNRRGS